MVACSAEVGPAGGNPADPPASSPTQSGPGRAGTERLRPEYDSKGRLQKLEYDRSGDGKIDTWGYMDGSRVVRVEADENGDGQVDRWEFHRQDAASPAASSDRTVERIERATRFDGRVSRVEYFKGGVLERIEEDTDGNGATDKWETYTDGSLSMLAIDTLGRGKPDRRLVYQPDGSLDRIEADAAGTGDFRALKP